MLEQAYKEWQASKPATISFVQGRQFKAYGAISQTLLQELNRTGQLFLIKGSYEQTSDRYVLSDITIPYGWWGSLDAAFYQVTKLIFNRRLAVMPASFGIWLFASAIYSLFMVFLRRSAGEEMADLMEAAIGVVDMAQDGSD